MLDRALRLALRNFSTLFLLAAAALIPLHLVYGYVFRSAIAVTPFYRQIGESRALEGVGEAELTAARLGWVVVWIVEIFLVVWLTHAASRVIEVDEEGHVPGVWDAWRTALARRSLPFSAAATPTALLCLTVAIAVGLLAYRIGSPVVDLLPSGARYAALALVEGASRSLAAPFFLTGAASTLTPAMRSEPSTAER